MEYLQQYFAELWAVTTAMAPYLLFGFLMAGVLSVLLPQQLVERHLGGRGLWPVAKAALLGVPLPLCSCGVIPVSASLRRHGASRGATTAFLIATPQTGADNIAIIYSLLGPVVAIFSPLVALVTGFVGGGIVAAVDDREPAAAAPPLPACDGACCNPQPGRQSAILRALHYGFVTLPADIAKTLMLGVAIAALIGVLVPKDYFAGTAIAGFPGMLLMMAIGIPIYVCSTASVPIAASFVAAGFSPGAALVFLLTGPSTNAATITTLWKILGRRTTLIYLATIAGGALLAGLGLNGLLGATHAASSVCIQCEQGAWWNVAAAIVLLLVLGYSLLPRRPQALQTEDNMSDETATLKIQGMNCSHCVESVRRALAGQPGVEQVSVDLAGGQAVVSGSGFTLPALVAAVESLGYRAQPA